MQENPEQMEEDNGLGRKLWEPGEPYYVRGIKRTPEEQRRKRSYEATRLLNDPVYRAKTKYDYKAMQLKSRKTITPEKQAEVIAKMNSCLTQEHHDKWLAARMKSNFSRDNPNRATPEQHSQWTKAWRQRQRKEKERIAKIKATWAAKKAARLAEQEALKQDADTISKHTPECEG